MLGFCRRAFISKIKIEGIVTMKGINKDKITGFISGTLITIVLLALSATAFASIASKQITASYQDIKVYVDGLLVTPKDANGNTVEPFTSGGTTYLPVRAIGNALGKDVDWDADTKSVYIGAKPGSATAYSRANPAPFGVEQTVTIADYAYDDNDEYYEYSCLVKLQVTDVIRGESAWKKIDAADTYDEVAAAPDGKEYIIFKVKATVLSSQEDTTVTFSPYDFTVVSNNVIAYNTWYYNAPQPQFAGQVYADGTIEGYCVGIVDIADDNPEAVYNNNYYDATGGSWFSLVE